MKFLVYINIICVIFFISIFGQSYSGPSTGTTISGVMVTTNTFTAFSQEYNPNAQVQARKYMEYYSEPDYSTGDMKVLNNYTYVEDTNAGLSSGTETGTSFELHSFESIPMTNSVPPDPIVAVGPYNVISMVNGIFYIYDRDGNLQKAIGDDAWLAPAINHPVISDPQVIYDHYEGRWVMLWLTVNEAALQSSQTICFSDDDDALGTWYIYATNGSVNGTTNSSAFGDYPQMGYDDLGIYLTTREFFFAGGGASAKIRIFNKSELYSANGGPITFTDLWNIRTLSGATTEDLHSTISYDAGNNTAYFVIVPNGGSAVSLYKIANPINNPVLTGVQIDVTDFVTAPLAQQLGGGTGIDTGPNGSGIRNAPIIRDGSLYAVHHIRNSQYATNVSIKYFEIDLNTELVVQEVEYGAQGFYYFYPSIAVDIDHNIAITYTRSADTEYAGSYYCTRLVNDPPGFSPSKVMTEGKGNYVVDGSGRNRWGDYLGAALDPVNQYNIWLFSEYAAAINTWGTWLTEIRMQPYSGLHGYQSKDQIDFGDVEINVVSDTVEVIIANFGTDNLDINSITSIAGPFSSFPDQPLPITLATYDSLTLKVIFAPSELGYFEDSLVVSSNDPNLSNIRLAGNSYEIIEPYSNIFYASSGGGNNGNMLTIDPDSGNGTILGPSLYGEIKSLAINQSTNILYGLVSGGSNSEIVRVNADAGDCYTLVTLDLTGLTGIDFDTTGTIYASQQGGKIFTIDLSNGNYSLVTTSTHDLNAIAFNPVTNQLFGALRKTFGSPKDSIYTIDLLTGEATPIGRTGFNSLMTNDMAFDGDGILYGVTGLVNQEGKFFKIDQANGTGTLIGTGVGFNHTTGLAYSLNGPPVVSIDGENSTLPESYSLKQNYPNPFNPTTKIEFSLPVEAKIQLIIYNILGQQVASLIDDQFSAGNHSVVWNSDNSNGNKLSSGIYLYKLKAIGNDGSEFEHTKKMILLK